MKTRQVVVAATDLQLGKELKAEDIHVIQWPAGSVPAEAFDSGDDVVGRGLIAPVVANEPILPAKLAAEGSRRRTAANHPAGDARGLGARQRRGRRRRLRAAGHARGRHRDGEPHAAADRRDLEGDSHQRPGARVGHEDRAGRRQGKPMEVSVVTMLVDPGEVGAPDARRPPKENSARASQSH